MGKGIRNAKDVLAWLDRHPASVDDKQSSLQRALWWVAVSDAETLRDLSARELAEWLLEGSKPLDEDSLTEHVTSYFDDPDAPTDEEAEEVESQLQGFFG